MIMNIKNIQLLTLIFLTVGCIQKKHLLEKSKEAQEQLNEKFQDSSITPLSDKDLENFEGLDFFPLEKDYVVKATFKKTAKKSIISFPTSDPEVEKIYIKYGEAHFNLKGKEYSLSLYEPEGGYDDPDYKDYLFVPFTDLTNGDKTYGAGRYLDLKKPKGNTVTLDFNQAYNPYCAYASGYSCPIPPKENNLKVSIEAGVKDYL